jgi:hypothetical protein
MKHNRKRHYNHFDWITMILYRLMLHTMVVWYLPISDYLTSWFTTFHSLFLSTWTSLRYRVSSPGQARTKPTLQIQAYRSTLLLFGNRPAKDPFSQQPLIFFDLPLLPIQACEVPLNFLIRSGMFWKRRSKPSDWLRHRFEIVVLRQRFLKTRRL